MRGGSLSTVTEKRTTIEIAGIIDPVDELGVEDLRAVFHLILASDMLSDFLTKIRNTAMLRDTVSSNGLLIKETTG